MLLDRLTQIVGYCLGIFGGYALSSQIAPYCDTPVLLAGLQASLYLIYPYLIEYVFASTPRYQEKESAVPNYPVILFNLGISQYIMTYLIWTTIQWTPLIFVDYFYELFLLTLGYEIGFYLLHRLFHTPFLYKWIHKFHHRYKAPIAISAVDTHPLEHMIVNLGPVYLTSLLIHPHLVTVLVLSLIGHITTMNGHSGI